MVKLGVCISSDGPTLVAEKSGALHKVLLKVGSVSDKDAIQAVVSAAESASLLEEAELAGEIRAADKWLPPIPRPGKILCVGLNYANHAIETGKTPPAEPLIFSKLRTCLRGCGDDIVLPNVTDMVDFEAELVVVIGKEGRDIPQAKAIDYVAGYMCGNDVSARDWQKGKPGGQWLLGKSFDSFAPTGPWFVPAKGIDPQDLQVQLRLNGETMQDAHTSKMLFPVEKLIAYVSQVCTLEPGDLIFTGTPQGVGVARDPQVFLQPGDCVEVEISGLGVLRNSVVAAKPSA